MSEDRALKKTTNEHDRDSHRDRRKEDRTERDRSDRNHRDKKYDDRDSRRDRERDRKRHDDSSRRRVEERSRSYERHKIDRQRSDNRDRRDRDRRDDRSNERKYSRSNRSSREKDRRRRSRTRSRSKSHDRNSRSNRKHSKESASNRMSLDLECESQTNDNNQVRIIPLSPSNHRTRSTKVAEQLLQQQQQQLETQQSNEKSELEYYINKSMKVNETMEIKGEITEEERNAIQEKLKERLRQHLEAEGKIYPPPKPKTKPTQAGFINDGSFLERFKQMQEHLTQHPSQQQRHSQQPQHYTNQTVPKFEDVNSVKNAIPQFGRRRGGKILKTGIVKKTINVEENGESTKDPWAIYLQEVKKYKKASCDAGETTRSLVK